MNLKNYPLIFVYSFIKSHFSSKYFIFYFILLKLFTLFLFFLITFSINFLFKLKRHYLDNNYPSLILFIIFFLSNTFLPRNLKIVNILYFIFSFIITELPIIKLIPILICLIYFLNFY